MRQAHRQTVFPAPRYDDAWAAIAYLESCFGFQRQTVHGGPEWDGGARRASTRDGELWLELRQRPRDVGQSLDLRTERRLCSAAGRERRRCAPRPRQGCGSRDCHAVGRHGLRLASYLVRDGDHRLWCFGTYNHAPLGEPTLFLVLRYPDRPATTRWLAHAFGFESALTSSLPAGRPSARNFVSATVPCG